MKDVKNANYIQKDNKIQIFKEDDVVILPSIEAYEIFEWSKTYFYSKPEEGYFIWVKSSPNHPLITNILACSKQFDQNMINLVIIEKDTQAKLYSKCVAIKQDLHGKHIGHTKIIVKENARIEINHIHRWGNGDTVDSSMDLVLKKGSEASLVQKCHKVPMELKLANNNYLEENSLLNYSTTVLAEKGKVEMYDSTYLNGKRANGVSRVRMICREKSRIKARSKMIANNAGTGHLDCMGLLLAKDSNIIAIPELINSHKDASLTHEASVGKISDEVLNYLRSRGLTEDQAIDLVITGFLGEEENIVIDGSAISSKLYM